jgi:formamidopyrimidine-DNA glycosylase
VPELPELQALAEGLTERVAGRSVEDVALWGPATLKTAAPPLEALVGRRLERVWRRGKLLGIAAGELTLLVHLMTAGRLGLAPAGAAWPRPPRRAAVLGLRLEDGDDLVLRELSGEHRASAHLLDAAGLAAHRQLAELGPEPLGLDPEGWRAALAGPGRPAARLHTAIRQGRRVAGIGRQYCNEILWAARLPPYALTDRLDDEAWARLARGSEAVLGQALARARERITTDLPDREVKVSAVHGHAGDPCLRCGTRLERVSFEGFDLVYCPQCQTGGRIYADRRRSRFLR